MKRLKGPELKLPNAKPPAFLVDVYWDLRDRRLLPLIGLVAVAIAAVPFLLGGREETTVPPLTAGAGEGALEAADASSLTVVEAQPGLRDYRRRLRGRSPSDPFKQRLLAPQLGGAQLNDGGGEGSGGGSGEGSGSGEGAGGEGAGGEGAKGPGGGSKPAGGDADGGSSPGSGGGAATQPAPAVDSFAGTIDVKIVREGGNDAASQAQSESSKPIVRHHVQPQSPLPGPNLPVFRYMGPSREAEGHRPLLLISTDVRSVFGDSRCIAGEEACQLLEVEPGFPVTFVYGPSEVHYTVTVLKIVPPAAGQG
jgi:hypothetical protein